MGKGDGRGSKEHTYAVTLVYFDRPGSRCSPKELSRETRCREAHFSGNGNLYNFRIGIPVDLFLCPKVAGAQPASLLARKNKSIESKFRTLELFPLHMFLAAKAPASTKVVS